MKRIIFNIILLLISVTATAQVGKFNQYQYYYGAEVNYFTTVPNYQDTEVISDPENRLFQISTAMFPADKYDIIEAEVKVWGKYVTVLVFLQSTMSPLDKKAGLFIIDPDVSPVQAVEFHLYEQNRTTVYFLNRRVTTDKQVYVVE